MFQIFMLNDKRDNELTGIWRERTRIVPRYRLL